MAKPECTILIPTWNGKDLLGPCLDSVKRALERMNRVFPVIVVDDGSRDGTIPFLAQTFPWVIRVVCPLNQGFARAVNHGMRCCTTPLVVLLNNDLSVAADFLPPLLEHFQDPLVFAVNPRVDQDRQGAPGGGLVRGIFHMGLLRLRWSTSAGERARPWETLYPNGAATAFDRGKFLALGGFDPIYAPFYSEDLDLGYRAWKRGWVTRYEPRSHIIHRHGGTIGRYFAAAQVAQISKRNRILFVWRNISDPWFVLSHLGSMKLRILAALVTGDRTFLKAVWAAWSYLPEVLRFRQREKPHRHLSDRAILARTARWQG